VRISPQPPLRTTGAYWKGGTTTTSGCGGLVLPVDYDWLMGAPNYLTADWLVMSVVTLTPF